MGRREQQKACWKEKLLASYLSFLSPLPYSRNFLFEKQIYGGEKKHSQPIQELSSAFCCPDVTKGSRSNMTHQSRDGGLGRSESCRVAACLGAPRRRPPRCCTAAGSSVHAGARVPAPASVRSRASRIGSPPERPEGREWGEATRSCKTSARTPARLSCAGGGAGRSKGDLLPLRTYCALRASCACSPSSQELSEAHR